MTEQKKSAARMTDDKPKAQKNAPAAASPRGPWQIQAEKCVFENPWMQIQDFDCIRPDGQPGKYGVVHFKNRATGILPISDTGMVTLVGQHRFPGDYFSWELPEGGCPAGEDITLAAHRELKEETGLKAARMLPLFEGLSLSNCITDERAFGFIAHGLTRGAPSPDATEVLSRREIPFAALLNEVMTGRIDDALTVMIVTIAHIKARQGTLPAEIARLILSQ